VPDTTRLDEITRTLLDARPDANPRVDWNTSRVQRHADQLTLQTIAHTTPRDARDSGTAPGGRESASSSPTGAPTAGTPWNWRAHTSILLEAHSGTLSIEPDPHGPIDLDTLPETLTIRQRQGGERLRPSRTGPRKTLKSLLQHARIPLDDRTQLPLIFSDEHLIAVADRWLDQSIQATPATQSRARLHWHRNTP
jgi:tRNA(Ile)-lysidine synthetase-like protein